MRSAVSLLALSFALATLAPATAYAEIYQCVGPDGRPLYTGDPSACPGASPHQVRGTLQRVPANRVTAAPARFPRAALEAQGAQSAEEAEEATWRARREAAEAELAAISSRVGEFRQLVSWCNRGGNLYLKDRSGLKRDYSCRDLRGEFEAMNARQAELRAYLQGGLEEECRRAGCLPGWIR